MNYLAALVMVAALIVSGVTIIAWMVGLWPAVPSVITLAGALCVGYAASRFVE
jgi:hypothetical protein